MKKPPRKLDLRRIRVRALTSDQMSAVNGGGTTSACAGVWREGNIAAMDDWGKHNV